MSIDGGEPRQLTDEKNSVVGFRWSPDGKRIAYLMTDPVTEAEERMRREKRDWHEVGSPSSRFTRLYVISVEGDLRRVGRRIFDRKFNVVDCDWSPDGGALVFSHQPTSKAFDNVDISRVDIESGVIRPVAATPALETTPLYSPDGQSIAFVASDDPRTWGHTGRVYVVSLTGGTARPLAETFESNPALVGWASDGRHVYIREAERTVEELSTLSVDGSPARPLSPPRFTVDGAALNASRTSVVFSSSKPDRPADLFVTALDRFAPVQVTHVDQSIASAPPLGRTEVVHWKAHDGLTIEGLLTYPVGYSPGVRVPLLVEAHGGPTDMFRQGFIGTSSPFPIAALASRGYAVLRCNVRGSSGYGRGFRYANYRDWGGGDFGDIMSGIDTLIAQGVVDPDRLGVMGWSYGGYMTAWMITQTNRFKAAIVGAGVTDLVSFQGTTDITGYLPDYFGGEYWDIFDHWKSRSPMLNLKAVHTPTLILHGEQDQRVPISQGYELYNALTRLGVTASMVTYPRQGHGIGEPKMVLDIMERTIAWFDRWVSSDGTSSQ